MIGPADGQVLIAYEFRIPAQRSMRNEVRSFDRSVRFFKKPGTDYYLCIGEGATQQELIKLANLSFIARIDRFYGE